MLFNSLTYLAYFLPTAFVLFWLIRRFLPQAASTAFLIVASLVFYGWFAPKMVLFLLVMMAINWALSRTLARARDEGRERGTRGRGLLAAAVTVNLLPLVFYKYTTFLFPPLVGVLKLAAPLGISYFTFVQISFLVDTFRSQSSAFRPRGAGCPEVSPYRAPTSALDYALASVFWPKTVAGPIIRPHRFVSQWRRPCNRRFFSHRLVLAILVFALAPRLSLLYLRRQPWFAPEDDPKRFLYVLPRRASRLGVLPCARRDGRVRYAQVDAVDAVRLLQVLRKGRGEGTRD